MENNTKITVENLVNMPLEKVWDLYTTPKHIKEWNHASDDWHTTKVKNTLRKGGIFDYRMEAKDGSIGFNFVGKYDDVTQPDFLKYTLEDGRKVEVHFADRYTATEVKVTFEAESENSLELQQQGWQAILDNFKKYAESQ